MPRTPRSPGENGTSARVVVGVDGSLNSIAALRWAERYARATGTHLHVLLVYEGQAGFGYAPLSAEDYEREAGHVLERAIKKAFDGEPPPGFTREIRHGDATKVLLDAAREAEVLVLGDRGYGGIAGLMLGGVSNRCVREAPCTVAVVRDQH